MRKERCVSDADLSRFRPGHGWLSVLSPVLALGRLPGTAPPRFAGQEGAAPGQFAGLLNISRPSRTTRKRAARCIAWPFPSWWRCGWYGGIVAGRFHPMPEYISIESFHAAMGRAIAEWASVEDAMRDLFTRLVVCGVTGRGMVLSSDAIFIPSMIFYSSTNFRSRLELMGRIFDRLIEDEALRSEWNAIINNANRLYAKRNIIAHGATWGNEAEGLTHIGWSPLEGKKMKMLSFQQVNEAAESFSKYAERVGDLAIAANHHLAARAGR